jgi:hypothetical protein
MILKGAKMVKEKKLKQLSIRVDLKTLQLLDALSTQSYESDYSKTVRGLIRKEAAERSMELRSQLPRENIGG